MANFLRSIKKLPLRNTLIYSSRACISTDPKSQTTLVKKDEKQEHVESVPANELTQVNPLSGLPDEQVNRLARIFMPSRNAMQSGSNNTHHWKLVFDNQERWENPLMGWTSSGDTLSNVTLSFNTKEAAISFAVRNGWRYEVTEPNKPTMRRKSYGENFSWDKKTRVSTK